MVGYGASDGGLIGDGRFLCLVVPVSMLLCRLRLMYTVAFNGSREIFLLAAKWFQLVSLLIGHRDAKNFFLRLRGLL